MNRSDTYGWYVMPAHEIEPVAGYKWSAKAVIKKMDAGRIVALKALPGALGVTKIEAERKAEQAALAWLIDNAHGADESRVEPARSGLG